MTSAISSRPLCTRMPLARLGSCAKSKIDCFRPSRHGGATRTRIHTHTFFTVTVTVDLNFDQINKGTRNEHRTLNQVPTQVPTLTLCMGSAVKRSAPHATWQQLRALTAAVTRHDMQYRPGPAPVATSGPALMVPRHNTVRSETCRDHTRVHTTQVPCKYRPASTHRHRRPLGACKPTRTRAAGGGHG